MTTPTQHSKWQIAALKPLHQIGFCEKDAILLLLKGCAIEKIRFTGIDASEKIEQVGDFLLVALSTSDEDSHGSGVIELLK